MNFSAQDEQMNYRCANLDNLFDRSWARKNRGKSEQEKCERLKVRTWTDGNNANYPGCGDCKCCAENGWIKNTVQNVVQAVVAGAGGDQNNSEVGGSNEVAGSD